MAQLDIWYNLTLAFARSYMALFMESIHVQGYSNIPRGPKIIVANHPNATDGFVLPFIFREKLHYMVEEDLFRLPILGKIIKLADQIPVQIGRGREALRMAQEKINMGHSVVIFPEGHLNHGEALRRAGTGATILALQTKAPVVPIGFYVPAESTKTFIRHMFDRTTVGRWQWGGKLYMTIGEPWLPGASATLTDAKDNLDRQYQSLRLLTEHMMDRVSELVAQANSMAR